jgi:hypothetical protein
MTDERFDTILAVVCATLLALAFATNGPSTQHLPFPGPGCPEWWPGCPDHTSALSATTAARDWGVTDPPPPPPQPHQPWPW